jgi:hypothetical protein
MRRAFRSEPGTKKGSDRESVQSFRFNVQRFGICIPVGTSDEGAVRPKKCLYIKSEVWGLFEQPQTVSGIKSFHTFE